MTRTTDDQPTRPELARALYEAGRAGRVALGGAFGSARALLLKHLAAFGPLFVVVRDPTEAEGLEDDLRTFAPDARCILFRPADPEAGDAPEGRVDASERLTALRDLTGAAANTIAVAPVAVLLEELPEPEAVERAGRTFRRGDRVELDALRKLAVEAGYLVVPMVSAPAEISVRGDIVDVFPLGESRPLRVELFDDVVESIRTFDLESQRSVQDRDAFHLPLLKTSQLSARARGTAFLDQHLPAGTLTLRFDPGALPDRLAEHAFAFELDRGAVVRAEHVLREGAGVDVSVPRVEGAPGRAFNLGVLSVQGLGGGVDGLPDSLRRLRASCDRIRVFAETDAEVRRLDKILAEKNLSGPDLIVTRGRIRAGFQDTAAREAWLTHLELLGRPRLWRPKPRRPAVPARAIQNLLELNAGDYVVHLTHGIARYDGMVRMKRDEGEEDFLVLEFDGGTTYYLPAAKIDLVQRYIGSGAERPKLDRIGGRSWAGKKAKVQKALAEIAGELIEVHAARESRQGLVHRRDDPMIEEFEASFPWTLTPDQARSMREIHADLDAPRPMDRLVCGDVGFGKTELALRAAFRVMLGGRQVAMLVPTTLLADQHFQTAAARFANYPIRAAVLSRFQTRKEQTSTLAGLESGSVDFVVGTHRLVSKDVKWKDIGLVIIDEEQRFGVKAKEALKKLRKAVDVLTLTATPIPRTLHMAMTGLRGISALNTPPPLRRPVRTELRQFDDEFLRRAILHELNRGGQVFFVHNRIAHLERLAERLLRVVPNCRPQIAHGQMSENDLEEAMRSFLSGESDVLLSTNIIESGLDLPRANTIFIDRPDYFGLADLHQLRGRVGRSEVQAYCYLLVPDEPLPGETERRLKAVEELSHLGAGYDIAIRDLEIRGAGNLLGAEQSGNIAAVGYDLYVQLLRRAIHKARGQPAPPEATDTDIDVGVSAFLPVEYVPDPGQRMELLRRLGAADGPPLAEMEAELADRFGRVPRPARNLLTLFALKRRCRQLGVRRMLYPGGEMVILDVEQMRRFQKDSPFSADELVPQGAAVLHLRLAEGARGPDRLLAFLRERMLSRTAAPHEPQRHAPRPPRARPTGGRT